MDKRILLLLLLHLCSAYSSPYNINQLIKRGEKYCGQRLVAMLSLVCKGNYFSPSKKSLNDVLSYTEYEEGNEYGVDDNEFLFPFLQKESVKSIIPARVRKTVGIVNECCYKSCSAKHLSAYCG